MVTKAELKTFLPKAKATLVDAVADNWPAAEEAGITTPRRVRQFLANIATETGGLTAIVESLTYTSAERIRATWPTRFKTAAAAQPYVRQARKLAIFVYGGRMGNAAAPSTDGWDFRGGGMMQTTGREGYRAMGFEKNPGELQSNPRTAFLTAVREWKNRGCNALADKDDTTAVRKAINGGTNGLDHVRTHLANARKVWPDGAGTPAARVEAAAGIDPAIVKEVQTLLRRLGYTEVGNADGVVGTMTRAAILAFRADNNLPLATTIDEEFRQVLATAPPRQIAEDRAFAPVAKVVEKVPEVKANFISKILSAVAAFFSGIVALITGVVDQFDAARAHIDPIRAYASNVPGHVWLLLVALVALAIFFVSRHGEQKGVAAFQSGERR